LNNIEENAKPRAVPIALIRRRSIENAQTRGLKPAIGGKVPFGMKFFSGVREELLFSGTILVASVMITPYCVNKLGTNKGIFLPSILVGFMCGDQYNILHNKFLRLI
jgi:hypothetical protein